MKIEKEKILWLGLTGFLISSDPQLRRLKIHCSHR